MLKKLTDKLMLCEECKCLLEEDYPYKDERGKLYCEKCKPNTDELRRNSNIDLSVKASNYEEFNKFLDVCIDTPPLRLKDLKERLKKEREEGKEEKGKSK